MSISSVIKSLRIRTICFLAKIDLLLLRPLFKQEDERLRTLLRKYGFSIVIINHPSVLFANYRGTIRGRGLFGIEPFVHFLHYALVHHYLSRERGTRMMRLIGIPEYFAKYATSMLKEYDEKYDVKAYEVPEEQTEQVQRVVVYTVMTGNYDNIKSPLYRSSNCDYVLFTNNTSIVNSEGWKVIQVHEEIDNLKLSRKIKMLPHVYLPQEYDTSIYVDASVLLYGNIVELVRFLDNEIVFVATKHGVRKRVIDELEACHEYQIITEEAYQKAITRYENYQKNGFTDDMGLAECGILVRRHSDERLQKVMEMWWQEFENGCGRDQIYLMPSISANKFESYRLLDGSVFANQYGFVETHNKYKKK